MARITLDGIAHAYDARSPNALERLDHVWQQGRAYALLGPSGCGKTTLLNIISGLIAPAAGRVLFDGKDVTHLPTERRNIAQVFQFPVIYDTMTVAQNLAFPLKNRGVERGAIKKRVAEIAALLGLTEDLPRRARGTTSETKQRISLGRGLVRADVAAILFDEPLTVIDPSLKWQLRSKLKAVHRALDLLMIYVTHDQVEALTFADEVVVMKDGRVLQTATPARLFEQPEHTFVGYFIGSPGMNLVAADVEGHVAHVAGHDDRAGGALSEARRRLDGSRFPTRLCLLPSLAAAFPCGSDAWRISGDAGWPAWRSARTKSSQPCRTTCGRRRASALGDPAGSVVRLRPRRARYWRSSMMEKPLNNRAWLMVAPVFVLVLFSALLPMMTVVNYSVQDSLGQNQFFWNGDAWFRELLDPSKEIGARFADALLRNLAFSLAALLIEFRSASPSRFACREAVGRSARC